ncbi:MAG TPA: response regulator transcription factor [Bryobacteraceae bacterium]|nr:response regulator transcription factor [Bryobacteraceae bacterium]
MSKIRVLLTDDHTLFRQGIRTLLSAEPDMEVAGEAANGSDAVTVARQTRPDVVLMDIGMAGMSSFEATRQIRKERPDTRVVFLSMYDDEDYVSECVDMGANGYILKESPSDQLLTAIREVHRGGSFLSPRLLSRLVDDFRTGGHGAIRQPRFGTLTKREREILKMLAEGRSVKEIATGFELSVKTVEAHKFNLMRKLDIHNKAQLVQYAIQKKIIRLPDLAFG